VYFWTDRRLRQIRQAVEEEGKKKDGKGSAGQQRGADRRFGTVGAVARKGRTLAAGTSTGGLTNKLPGRVGDSP
jgi:beta-aspartyl-peptidase (threonine type)